MFKCIRENVSSEIIEKKSKFIANLFYIETVEEAEKIIKEMNKKYFDSRHNCYAFCVETEEGRVTRFSDDGEPSGTAGAPMLNILTSQNLSNLLVVVTRYFGGVLLGTGGLVRAYTGALVEALNKVEIVEKELGKQIELAVDYSDLEKIKYYLKQSNVEIIDVKYQENVYLMVEVTQEKLDRMLEQKENLNFKLLNWKIIKENTCIFHTKFT